MRPLRVAVVGSGPAGLYAAAELAGHEDVSVDLLDRLPTPYGLVRYGVAPDHFKIKSVVETLRRVLDNERVRFLGNVELGSDLTVAELHRHYDAFVVAVGASRDRRLGVQGEDLPGSFSATEFVAWYSGHPDAAVDRFTLDARSVAVLGVGNVAVDVARIMAKTAAELQHTDVPDHVLKVLASSQVQDVYVIGRRGAAHAKFTTKELRDLGELANADVVVEPSELELDEQTEAMLADSPVARRNLAVLTEWSQRPAQGRPRRLHLRFLLRPTAITGSAQVEGLTLARGRLVDGEVRDTGEQLHLPVQMVLRSIGYRGSPLPDLPFDEERGVVPNSAGRILRDGASVPGQYVAGWIKRGPSGIIGTNRLDAQETVQSLLDDAADLPVVERPGPDAVLGLLRERGVRVVEQPGWEAIDRLEIDNGRPRGADRVKITDRGVMLTTALAAQADN